MNIIVDMSSLILADQINIRHELKPYLIKYLSEMLLVVTFNQKVGDILWKYNILEHKPYK